MVQLPFSITNPAFTMRSNWAVSKAEKTCLEIGCSIGIFTDMLSRKHYTIAGDIDKQAIAIAKKRNTYKANVDFVLFDALLLPFKNKSISTITLIDVLEHLKNPEKVLAEATQVCSHNLLIDVPNYDFGRIFYPNMVPEHFKEPSHIQRTNLRTLNEWLSQIHFSKKTIHGSCIPMPFLFVGLSYFFEKLNKTLSIKPSVVHFQISCELIMND
jgi:2-polyprenyl-3-methyl-5-hydroxy-6-metoxy-1,4-benzoquinol methylase